jgi:hypothetical protein
VNTFAGRFLVGYGFCVALDLLFSRGTDAPFETALTNPFNVGAGVIWALWKAT